MAPLELVNMWDLQSIGLALCANLWNAFPSNRGRGLRGKSYNHTFLKYDYHVGLGRSVALSKSVNATEVARNFSDVLNQVKYQSTSFEVMRGRDVVARIVPAGQSHGLRVSDLNALFAKLPRLGENDADVLEPDIGESLAQLTRDDLIIAATAIRHGFPVLTANMDGFSKMPGLAVLKF